MIFHTAIVGLLCEWLYLQLLHQSRAQQGSNATAAPLWSNNSNATVQTATVKPKEKLFSLFGIGPLLTISIMGGASLVVVGLVVSTFLLSRKLAPRPAGSAAKAGKGAKPGAKGAKNAAKQPGASVCSCCGKKKGQPPPQAGRGRGRGDGRGGGRGGRGGGRGAGGDKRKKSRHGSHSSPPLSAPFQNQDDSFSVDKPYSHQEAIMSKYLQQSKEQLNQSSSMKHTGMSVIDQNITEETFDDADLDNLESASQIGMQPLALAPAKSPKHKKSKRASKSKVSSQSSDEKSPKKSLISTPSEASISVGSTSDLNLAPKEPERLDRPVDGPEPASFVSGSQVGIPPMIAMSHVDQASPQRSDQAPPQKGDQPLKKEVDISKPTYGRKTFLGSLMELTTMCTCCRNKDYVAPKAWQEEDYSDTDNWNPMADLRVVEEYYEDEEMETASQAEEEEDDDDEVNEGDDTSGIESDSESNVDLTKPPPVPEPPPAAPRDVKIVVQLTEEDASEVESNASISETNVDGEAYSAGESDEDSTTVTDSTNTTSSTRT